MLGEHTQEVTQGSDQHATSYETNAITGGA